MKLKPFVMKSYLLFLLPLFLVTSAQAQPLWLQGHWANGTSEEVWSAHKGHTMLGYHREVKGNDTVFWEFLKITDSDEGVFYWALPSGQSAVEFQMKQWAPNWVLFVNEKNDFPTQIKYEIDGEKLTVTISGKGKESSWSFHKKGN